jgi:hypothetical protein
MNAQMRGAGYVLLAVILAAAAGARASAMPVFAKAYGVQCSVCHTQVPALNAYGRYVQRTGYSSLSRDALKTVPPLWVGEQINGDSTAGVSSVHPSWTSSYGNLALHGAGYIAPDWTFHVQQWLLSSDTVGGTLDTAWVTYNNIFHRDGHLFLGKVEAPAPSPFSQWFDIAAFATPEITVGEHAYQLDGNRWGTKFAYVHGALEAQAGYLDGSGGLPVGADYAGAGADKTFEWKLDRALPDQPLEYGVYGATGSYVVSTGDVDHYHAIAGYVQSDPRPGFPGVFAIYQLGYDANPGLDQNGNQLPGAASRAFTAELYQPVFSKSALLGIREEYTDDGLGTIAHSTNIDFAFNVPHVPYLHAYMESALGASSAAPNGQPDWRWMLWYTAPL